jgi:large repetitive protein
VQTGRANPLFPRAGFLKLIDFPYNHSGAEMAIQTHCPSKAIILSVGSAGEAGATNSLRPVMTGTADANTTVILYDGVRYLGSTVVSASGEWSFTPPIDVKTGKRLFTAISRDSQGNQGNSSEPMHVTVDATARPPVLHGLTDAAGHVISPGGVTGDSHPSISGTGGSGHTITVYDGSTVIGSTTVSPAGTWSLTPATDLPNGQHNVYAIEQNLAGASSAASKRIAFEVYPLSDAPAIFVLGEYDVNHINVGDVPSGGTTAYARLQLEGYSVPGALIKVYDGMTLLGSAVAKFNGTWAFYSENWSNEQHDLTATQTNTTGVESARSEHVTFTVGCYGPEAPMMWNVSVRDAHYEQMADHLQSGSVVTYPYISVMGSGERNGIVTLYDGSTVLGTTVVGAMGTWFFFAPALSDGRHDVTATLTSTNGQVSSHSDAYVVNVDTSGYAAPIILSIRDSAGAIPEGHSTHETDVVIAGTGQVGDLIKLYDAGTIIGSAIVDSTRHWSIETSTPLTSGVHFVKAMSALAAGTPDASSPYYIFMVDTESLAAPEILRIVGYGATGHYMDEINQSGDVLACASVKIYGSGEMGSTVQVFDGGNPVGSVKVDGYGAWNLSIRSIGAGFHDLVATQTNTLLEVSPVSQHWIFTVSTAVQAILGTGELIDPVDPSVFVSARAAENPDDLVPPANITPVAPRAPMIGGKTRAVVPIDESTHKDTQPETTQAVPLVTIEEHVAVTPTTSGHTMDLAGDPAAYFKQSTVHVQGSASGVDTLHLAGDHQVLNLTSLSGKTAAAKISGIEIIDLGGQHNTLKLSLVDVLNLGEQDLFRNDGKQQMMVNGKAGDTVDLSNAPVSGIAGGEWEQHDSAVVGGASYNVYEHSGAHIELLVQQGVLTALHN